MSLANVVSKINGVEKSVKTVNAPAKPTAKMVTKPAAKTSTKPAKKTAEKNAPEKMYEPRWIDSAFQVEIVEVNGRPYFQILAPINTEKFDRKDKHQHEHGYSENGFRLSKPSEYTGESKSENLASTGGMGMIEMPEEMAEMFEGRQVYLNLLVTSPLKGNSRLKF